MALDRPTKNELLEAVREFLETKVMKETTGALQFNTRVAINVLKILERELESGEKITDEASERIRTILGTQETSPDALNKALSEALESGEVDYKSKQVLDHLRQTTLDKLSVDNPKYSAYLEEKQK